MKPQFFATPAAFRRWLLKHHQTASELLVGFYKVHTGKPSLTWSQSVDEALCFGWIDGVRTSLGEDSYQIRFTPRKPNSIWSAVNIEKVRQLTALGLMQPAGIKSFEGRNKEKAGYTHEHEGVKLALALEKEFKAHKAAWKYFDALPPGYKKSSINWVMSAKLAATQLKRLQQLITDSEAGVNMFKENKYRK